MSIAPFRVGIVDDDHTYRYALGTFLNFRNCEVVFSADSCAGALQALAEHRPDILLLDYVMPGIDGPATLREIRARDMGRGTVCLFLTIYNDIEKIAETLKLADGYVTKGRTMEPVLGAIHAALAGKRPVLVTGVTDLPYGYGQHPLSLRERQTARLIVAGHSSVEIARMLDVQVRTVYVYRRNIFEKLGLGPEGTEPPGHIEYVLRHYLAQAD